MYLGETTACWISALQLLLPAGMDAGPSRAKTKKERKTVVYGNEKGLKKQNGKFQLF